MIRSYIVLLLSILLCTCGFGQDDFLVIMKRPNVVSSLGAGQTFTDKWPIVNLSNKFRTIIIDVNDLVSMDVDQFIDDMNSNSRITMLEITSRKNKENNLNLIQSIPFRKLKYIKHLAYTFDSYRSVPLDSIIIWNDILEMEALEYLYFQPYNDLGYSGSEVSMPIEVANSLATRLTGYVNTAYSGEFDEVGNNFEYLGIGVRKKQKNQTLKVLNNSLELKNLVIDIDTLSSTGIKSVLSSQTIESLTIKNPKLEFVEHYFQSAPSKLPRLKYLNCNANNLKVFQSISHQLTTLIVKANKEHGPQIENFLSSSSRLTDLNIYAYRDSILRFVLDPNLPLKRLTIHGRLKSLPNNICSFTDLEGLYLKYNKIEELPNCLADLNGLKEVDFNGNNLTKEPPFWSWDRLESLNLSENKIDSIRDCFCENSALRYLSLRNNPMDCGVQSLSCLNQLEELDLSNTCTHELPIDIDKLEKLKILKLNKNNSYLIDDSKKVICKNYLKGLPKSFSNLKNLKSIDLRGQKLLTENDVEILLRTNSNSVEINLSRCEIETLPKENWRRSMISKIDLSSNKIDSLPPTVYNTTIEQINLRGNQLGMQNQKISNETEKLIWQFTGGFDVSKELGERSDLIDVVVRLGNRYYSRPKENPILKLMPLILPLDTLRVLSAIKASSYGEALFESKRYSEAEKYLSMAIKRYKQGCFIFVNAIAELYDDRHKCYLELGDTTAAIKDLELIHEEYGYYTADHIFSLELERNNVLNIRKYKSMVLERLFKSQEADSQAVDVGIELGVLELHLVTNDAPSFLKQLQYLEGLDRGKYEPVFLYLKNLFEVSEMQFKEESIDDLLTCIEKTGYKNEKWSCRWVQSWAKHFGSKERQFIYNLNKCICP